MALAAVQDLEKQAAQKAVEDVAKTFSFNYEEVADTLGVDRRTVYRYRRLRSVPTRKVRMRFDRLREIIQLLEGIFETPEARRVWLYGSVPLLNGRRPIDLMLRGDLEDVASVLAGLQAGAHI